MALTALLAEQLVGMMQVKRWHIRCVESCTVGLLTAAFGEVSGVSSVLDRSWVTYSNQAKVDEVGVSSVLLETYGAVSEQVVMAMAEGAVQGCERTTLSLSVSGIAGPSGGTATKPVGTVWVGLKIPKCNVQAECFHFAGSRQAVQRQAVHAALDMVFKRIK